MHRGEWWMEETCARSQDPFLSFLSMSQPLSGLSHFLRKSKHGSHFTKVGILSLGIISFFENHTPSPQKDAGRIPPCNMHYFACIFRVFVESLRAILFYAYP